MARATSEVVRGEMIGRTIRVTQSKNAALEGVSGTVIDETKNTFRLETEKGRKTVLKEQVNFETEEQGKKVQIEGEKMLKRPEDRIKSKVS